MKLDFNAWRYHSAHGARLFKAGEEIPADWTDAPHKAALVPENDGKGGTRWKPSGAKGAPVPAEPAAEDDAPAAADASNPEVDIPPNWRELHHFKRLALAAKISGAKPASVAEADAAIEAASA